MVITPHPGEMARLLDVSVDAVQANRLDVARDFATTHHLHVVLKGHRTVVAAPDGRVSINMTGNPGMATGGTGDVLAGMIAGLLAQGMPAFEAAAAAVWLHGAAAARFGPGLIAGDLPGLLPPVLAQLRGAAPPPR